MSARPAHVTAGQLALELPAELPALSLAPEWKDQQRLWGHTFHPMCSYLASFPAALTHAFIARYSRPGDVVLDPFMRDCLEVKVGCTGQRTKACDQREKLRKQVEARKVIPWSSARAVIWAAMTSSLLEEDPDALVAPYLMSGGTDAKYFADLGIRCFGFAPLRLPADLDFTALFHGVDERVPVDALEFGARVFDRFLGKL